MTPEVQHDPQSELFFADVDGQRAVLNYRLADETMTILHTGVPDAIGGRGVAARLTSAALDLARAKGWKVRPRCSYAVAFLRRHPEYADLIAP